MPELGPLGSVRGAAGNSRPYRERSLTLIVARQQTFMPVHVAALGDGVAPSRAVVGGLVGNLGRIEVTLGNGRVLKVDASIDPAALAVIAAALEDDPRLRQDGRAP